MNISTATISASLTGTATSTFDLSTPTATFTHSSSVAAFTNGTGTGNVNQYWSNNATIAASGTASLDLAGGLTDVYGDTITFTAIKGLIVTNESGNGAEIEVGGNANAFSSWLGATTDSIKISDGGFLAFGVGDATGYAVTASTGDILDINNNDGSLTAEYSIVIIGEV